MIKVLSAFIAGLAFYRFLPQFALFAVITAAIILAILIEEQHGFMKKLRTSKRKTKKRLPAMRVAKAQGRTKKA